MFDYVFFHPTVRDRFIARLRELNVACESRETESELVVSVDEDLADDVLERIDGLHEQLLDEEQARIEQFEAPERHAAGITIRLQDGRSVQAAVDPELLNRLLQAVTIEELGSFVQTIAAAVENPDDVPFCQKAARE